MSLIQYIKPNPVGEDYICSDIHGCYSLLDKRLQEVGFNRDTDRLFVVGDLIDRGPENQRVLDYIDQPWFFSVLGNHEVMMLSANLSKSIHDCHTSTDMWLNNGGDWWLDIDHPIRERIISSVRHLPLVIELEYQGKRIGITHADVQSSWSWMIASIQEIISDDIDQITRNRHANFLLWSRTKAYDSNSQSYDGTVTGIDHVFHGHTIMEAPRTCGNVTFIDTGSYRHQDLNRYPHATITVAPIGSFLTQE